MKERSYFNSEEKNRKKFYCLKKAKVFVIIHISDIDYLNHFDKGNE